MPAMAPPKNSAQTPVRSPTQRMEALQKANEIRSRRAQLKKELKNGDIHIVDVLRNPPEYVQTAKVLDLLLVVPKYGRVKATKVLTRCRISPAKTVVGLSERQRIELIEALENRENGK